MLPVNFYGRVEHNDQGAKWVDAQVNTIAGYDWFEFILQVHTHIYTC